MEKTYKDVENELIIICKDKDNVVAEYSLEEVSQPIGIAGYELSDALSKEYRCSLPTIEALESEVAKMTDGKHFNQFANSHMFCYTPEFDTWINKKWL